MQLTNNLSYLFFSLSFFIASIFGGWKKNAEDQGYQTCLFNCNTHSFPLLLLGDNFELYNDQDTNIIFPPGSQNGMEICSPLGRVVGDDLIEYDMSIQFQVSPTDYRDKVTASGNTSATFDVTIIDDDCKLLVLGQFCIRV